MSTIVRNCWAGAISVLLALALSAGSCSRDPGEPESQRLDGRESMSQSEGSDQGSNQEEIGIERFCAELGEAPLHNANLRKLTADNQARYIADWAVCVFWCRGLGYEVVTGSVTAMIRAEYPGVLAQNAAYGHAFATGRDVEEMISRWRNNPEQLLEVVAPYGSIAVFEIPGLGAEDREAFSEVLLQEIHEAIYRDWSATGPVIYEVERHIALLLLYESCSGRAIDRATIGKLQDLMSRCLVREPSGQTAFRAGPSPVSMPSVRITLAWLVFSLRHGNLDTELLGGILAFLGEQGVGTAALSARLCGALVSEQS